MEGGDEFAGRTWGLVPRTLPGVLAVPRPPAPGQMAERQTERLRRGSGDASESAQAPGSASRTDRGGTARLAPPHPGQYARRRRAQAGGRAGHRPRPGRVVITAGSVAE